MLGSDLRAARIHRSLTVAGVAQHAHISEATLRSVENGRRYPSLRTLEALAECLQITVVIGPTETTVEW